MIVAVRYADRSKACAAIADILDRTPGSEHLAGMLVRVDTDVWEMSPLCGGRAFRVVHDELWEALMRSIGMKQTWIDGRRSEARFLCEHAIEIGD